MTLHRRAFAALALGAAAGLSGCAGGDGPGAHEPPPEMLFISPMGEPFRAKVPEPYPVAAWFKGADKDGDGQLTLAEFLADTERFFKVLDVNKDGVVDHREINYYERELVPEILGREEGRLRLDLPEEARLYRASSVVMAAQSLPGVGGGQQRGSAAPPPSPDAVGKPPSGASRAGAAPYGLLFDPEPVRGSDLRLSGRISLQDFKTRAQQRFALLDEHSRGYLTLDTLPETEVERLLPRRPKVRVRA